MTPYQTAQIKRLFKLADLAQEFDVLIDFKLVDQWCKLREQHGLAKTLLLIQEYAIQNFLCQGKIESSTSETQHPNQNADVV